MHDMTMRVRPADDVDMAAVGTVLSEALSTGPVVHWFDATAEALRAHGGAYFSGIAGQAIADGNVDIAEDEDGVVGSAVWRLQVGDANPAAVEGVRPPIAGSLISRIGAVDASLRMSLPKETAFHRLICVGVRPERQGAGIGRALLAAHLDRIRLSGFPAYVEATTEHNRAFFRTAGFVDHDRPLDLPRGIRIWPMLRPCDPFLAGGRAR